MVEMQVYIPREIGVFKSIGNQGTIDQLDKAGYTSNEENARYIVERGGVNLDIDDPWTKWDDEGFRVKVVVPITNSNFIAAASSIDQKRSLVDRGENMLVNQLMNQEMVWRPANDTDNNVRTQTNAAAAGFVGFPQQ